MVRSFIGVMLWNLMYVSVALFADGLGFRDINGTELAIGFASTQVSTSAFIYFLLWR